jgi:hypothetical protein
MHVEPGAPFDYIRSKIPFPFLVDTFSHQEEPLIVESLVFVL